jgi:hypothetical protein
MWSGGISEQFRTALCPLPDRGCAAAGVVLGSGG